ncbi:MAG: hypothetical protein V2A66_10765 [Pseudomonadota bacterium]
MTRKILNRFMIAALLICLAGGVAHSSEDKPATISSEAPAGGPEFAPLHKALDRRDRFSKKWQSEIEISGGDYLGDEWLNTWDAGARYMLHVSNAFSVGASYLYSYIRANSSTSFGNSLTTNNSHILDAEVSISNDCAIRAGKTIIDSDLFFTLGGGTIYINHEWKPAFVVGGGIKVYTPLPWLAVRFDVNALLHPTPIPSGDKFNADVIMNGGVSFLFPVRKISASTQGPP